MADLKLSLEDRILIGKRASSGGETAVEIAMAYGDKFHPSTATYCKKHLDRLIAEWKRKFPDKPIPHPGGNSASNTTVSIPAIAVMMPGADMAKAALGTVKHLLREHMKTAENPDLVYLQAQAALTALGG